jgi:hypothetical protein
MSTVFPSKTGLKMYTKVQKNFQMDKALVVIPIASRTHKEKNHVWLMCVIPATWEAEDCWRPAQAKKFETPLSISILDVVAYTCHPSYMGSIK